MTAPSAFILPPSSLLVMSFRVTDSSTSRTHAARVSSARTRSLVAQEKISTGKRINRPSDDPASAEKVLRLQGFQAEVKHFQRNTASAETSLRATEGAIDNYENVLDRVRTLLVQGATDTAPPEARAAVAAEIESLRGRIVQIANERNGDSYIFGGTRQDTPPFAVRTAPAPPPAPAPVPTFDPDANPALVQLEPDTTPSAVGTTGKALFADATGTVLETLDAAVVALRGTADPVADKAALQTAMTRAKSFADRAGVVRTTIGVALNNVDSANERLSRDTLLLGSMIQQLEGADLAESAIEFAGAERALEAVLQVTGRTRRSLVDFLG